MLLRKEVSRCCVRWHQRQVLQQPNDSPSALPDLNSTSRPLSAANYDAGHCGLERRYQWLGGGLPGGAYDKVLGRLHRAPTELQINSPEPRSYFDFMPYGP